MSEPRLPKDALDALVAAATTPPPEPLGAALARLAEELGQPATDAVARSSSAPRP